MRVVMRTPDLLSFALRSLGGARTRTLLMLLAMSIGVASVVLRPHSARGAPLRGRRVCAAARTC